MRNNFDDDELVSLLLRFVGSMIHHIVMLYMGLLYFLIGILCTARQLPYLMSSNNTKCMYLPGTLPGTVKLIAISLLILD